MFDHVLPDHIDWDELNRFFSATRYVTFLSHRWREADAFLHFPLSETSMLCLQCLHDDLCDCYGKAFAFDENGAENRPEEYRLLKNAMFTKYSALPLEVLEGIYNDYLYNDR